MWNIERRRAETTRKIETEIGETVTVRRSVTVRREDDNETAVMDCRLWLWSVENCCNLCGRKTGGREGGSYKIEMMRPLPREGRWENGSGLPAAEGKRKMELGIRLHERKGSLDPAGWLPKFFVKRRLNTRLVIITNHLIMNKLAQACPIDAGV
ncbi:hypothetical protein ACLOJK_014105 [Asimina triloba]